MTAIEFSVRGIPIPKGSTRAFMVKMKDGKERPIITSTAKGLAHWENLIGDRATEAYKDMEYHEECQPWYCPVSISLTFCLPKPKSLPKRKRNLGGALVDYTPRPTTKPDLDKLCRAALDAITGIIIKDDSQVVGLIAVKEYGGSPGVKVTVEEIKEGG